MNTQSFKYSIKQKTNGFIINSIDILREIDSVAYQIEHIKTNAKLIYLHNNTEKENLFSIAFKTPSIGNLGIPHILEHCTLCGSKKYPCREIFTELLKSSTATFINAMTYSDKTVYPFMSINEIDFIHLLKIYCDAVFFPNITREDFIKESYTLNKNLDDIVANGVVYNEMIGVYSDIVGIVDREMTKNLFQKSVYGRDSGGSPASILKLKYDKLIKYHKKYYHPSNSYTIIYGSININKILQILDIEYFSNFDAESIEINTIQKQPQNFTNEKIIRYPSTKTDKNSSSIIISGFKTNEITETITTLALKTIEIYMFDKDSSPLKSNIIKSSICNSIIYSGYFCNQLKTYFCIGIDGTEIGLKQKFLDIIKTTFQDIIKNGFERDRIKSALNKLEFECKNIEKDYPIKIMNNIYDNWMYDIKNPFSLIEINRKIEELKKIASDKNNKFFEKLLQKYLLNNNCRFNGIFKSDKKYHVKLDNKLNKCITKLSQDIKNDHMSNETEQTYNTDIDKLIKKTIMIPIKSIKHKTTELNYSLESVEKVPIISVNTKTNDICHLYISFNFKNLDEELIKYLTLFEILLLKVGTKNKNFSELDNLESNISCKITSEFIIDGSYNNSNRYSPILLISAKVLKSKIQNLVDIIVERLTECDFYDKNRIKQVILEEKSNIENSIIYFGSKYAVQYANKNVNLNLNISEQLNGISKLELLNSIIKEFPSNIDKIIAKLYEIKKQLINKNNMTVSTLFNNNSYHNIISKLISNFNYVDLNQKKSTNNFIKSSEKTFITTSSGVSFNSTSISTKFNMCDRESAIIFAISNFLSYDYIWNEIREKGGAYGAGLIFPLLDCCLNFYTYRDPKIIESYKTFLKLREYVVRELKLNKSTINKIIIGSIKKFNTPIRQDSAGKIALLRYLNEIDEEKIDNYKELIFNIKANEIRDIFDQILTNDINSISMCTISNVENFNDIKKELSNKIKFDLKTII